MCWKVPDRKIRFLRSSFDFPPPLYTMFRLEWRDDDENNKESKELLNRGCLFKSRESSEPMVCVWLGYFKSSQP